MIKFKKNYHTLIKKEINYVFGCLSNVLSKDNKYLISHVNANTGKIINGSPIFEDFGDIAPLLILCKKKLLLKK